MKIEILTIHRLNNFGSAFQAMALCEYLNNMGHNAEIWFDALDYMYEECKQIDFDVAIIGCGAYGLPLAAKLKSHGKQVIHLGGATQLMFGIKGKRWDEMPEISKYYNEYWVRPNKNEVVKDGNKVENGCYW